MVALASLWLPIVVSAVLVFIASSIIHMALKYHHADFDKLPDEDKVRAALREAGVTPGDYLFPRADDPSEQMSEAMLEKWKQGPAGTMTVMSSEMGMGKQLAQWFVYSLVASLLVAYVLSRTTAAGVEYMQVFQIASTVAFLIYAGAEPIRSIWWRRSWASTLRQMFDGLVYGLVTAGAFGWLWPGA